MNWYLKVLRNYVVFSGRARRKEYWMFVLFNFIFGTAAKLLDKVFETTIDTSSLVSPYFSVQYGYINLIYSLATFLPSFAVLVRRLHDVGKSGWILLLFIAIVFGVAIVSVIISSLIGFVGASVTTVLLFFGLFGVVIWFIVILCTDSQPGENKYGPNPKDPNQPEITIGEALDSSIKL